MQRSAHTQSATTATTVSNATALDATRSESPTGFRQSVIDLALNAFLLLGLYVAYALVRQVTADDWATAHLNADRLLDFQRAIGLPSEADLQRSFFLDKPLLVRAANMFYMWAHFPVTAAFMVWVWLRHRSRFGAVRNTLIMLTAGGLVLHLVFPLAPPRMKPSFGFVDTGVKFGPSPYDLGAAEAANQLAAMPSLHVGWAVLVALSVVALSRHRLRYLIGLHPILTTTVVVLTANHYWTDAIIAIVLVTASWLYTAKVSAISTFTTPPPPGPYSVPRLYAPIEAGTADDGSIDLRDEPITATR